MTWNRGNSWNLYTGSKQRVRLRWLGVRMKIKQKCLQQKKKNKLDTLKYFLWLNNVCSFKIECCEYMTACCRPEAAKHRCHAPFDLSKLTGTGYRALSNVAISSICAVSGVIIINKSMKIVKYVILIHWNTF
jgi:hypothetical protein